MGSGKYTGPSARRTMDARRESASSMYDLLYKSPEDIVNEIVSDLGLDERYHVESNGRVGQGYSYTTPEERARASEQIQRELMGRCREAAEKTSQQSQTQQQRPKRRVRYDRIAALGMVMTLIGSLGYTGVKHLISGVKGDPGIEKIATSESSISDSIITGTDEISVNGSETAPDVSTETQYVVPDMRADRIAYVIDFMDYYNESEKEHIMQMLDNEMIDGLGIRIGGSKMDYPFTLKNFIDDEINNELQWYVDTGKVALDHKFGQEIAWAEEFIQKAPVTIPYFYTCAVNYEEAEIEATCIEATYNKMKNDMPEYDFENRMAPITIDIEECGEIKEALNEDFLTQIGAKKQRADAVLHLIDSLRERGVIDERGVIIYGDLNRMADETQIDWNALFEGLEERNINVVKWGTRAIRDTFDNKIEYNDIYAFRDALMNTSTNISYMKSNYDELQPYLKDVAIQQIHLGQTMKTSFTYPEEYDVNITTANTLDAIVHGDSIEFNKGFVDRIEDVRMQEVKKDLQTGDSQAEEYVPEEFKKKLPAVDAEDR